jgi:hypothetical protein
VKRPLKLPDPALVGPETPLRLEVAVALAFPDGGLTISGLRKEHARGRLRLERIANKDFVTLKAIEEMRQRCVVDCALPQESSAPVSPRPAGYVLPPHLWLRPPRVRKKRTEQDKDLPS